MPFTHLHVHSRFSPQWGIHNPERLCLEARAMGMTHLALTDRNGLYGIPHFLACAYEAGITPIVGSDIHAGGERALVLARGRHGYEQLCELLSERHTDPGFELAAALRRYRQGLTVISDHPQLLRRLRVENRDELYVELSPGHDLAGSLRLARQLGLPPVATCRAVLLEDDDYLLHQVLRAIAFNTTLERLAPTDCARSGDRLLSPDEVAAHFPHCPEALRNTARVAAACAVDWDFAPVFPTLPEPVLPSAQAELERRARAGAARRYGRLDQRGEARLTRELELIAAKGFANYFLVVDEIARQSRRTCGRGSAAASLVAYCLGITHVDPLRYNLFFERFLNEGRLDPPDIDIDFPWDERDAILDFIFARHSARRTAMVANQIGFKGRGALREVAKVFGIPAAEIKQVTRRVSGYWRAEQTARAVENHPLFRGDKLTGDWPLILSIASRMRHQLRHLGLHCGGVVIVPGAIRRQVPVEVSAKGLPVIQWEKDQAEAAGLVKIDVLGNRSLAVIRDALAAVKDNTGRDIDYAVWRPLEDPATRELLCRGASMGCFYIESPATRQLLERMFGRGQGEEVDADFLFEHLVMASSIIRPAANAFIREFVARLRGKSWRCLHPLLEPVLGETYGIAVYQEQITQMAMALAGFDAFHGDQLRKIISNKHHEKKLADYRKKFFIGGRDKGLDDRLLDKAWRQILSFGGYSFCKPHSASYVLVSAKAAWLKANYPAEFMAAVISNQGGYYSPEAYLSECRRMGLEVLPPNINVSGWHYIGQGRQLRVGLMQISGLNREEITQLLAERSKNGSFSNFGEVLERCELSEESARRLIGSGCFDALEGKENRSRLVWKVLEARQGRGTVPLRGQSLLFPTGTVPGQGLSPNGDCPPPNQPLTKRDSPAAGTVPSTAPDRQGELLGFDLGQHPLAPFRERLLQLGAVPARDLLRYIGRRVRLGGWWVTGKTVQTKKDEPMQFITFEDESALFETTFFPKAYERYCRLLGQRRPYLVEGLVEEEFGIATLTVERLSFLPEGGGF